MLHHQRGVGAAKAEGVRQDRAEFHPILPLAQDRHVGEGGVDLGDVGALGHEAVLHHQKAIDRLLHASSPQRMAGERLGGGDGRDLVPENRADRLDLLEVADGGRGRVGVDIVDGRLHGGQGLAHAAHGALPRGGHHVMAIGGRAIAHDLGVDLRAARLGVLIFFQHQNARAARNHETVACLVISARGRAGGLVVAGGHGAHGVEEHGQGPVELLATAREHHILLAPLDHFSRIADAMGRGGAGRGDGIVDAPDLEPGGEGGRSCG